MPKIKVHDRIFRLMIPEKKLMSAIDDVASRLNDSYYDGGSAPMLLCVLNGAMPFTAELMKRLHFDFQLQSIKVSSYEGIKSTGHLTTILGPTADVKGQRIIICEDLVDTGITIRQLKKMLLDMGASDVKVCSMLFKPGKLCERLVFEGILSPDASQAEIQPYMPDFYGLEIGDEFIVGFGLDYDELGRGYPDIYVLDE